jgi:hypothetical protein
MGAAYSVSQGTFLRMRQIIKMLWKQSAGTRLAESSRNKYVFIAPKTPLTEKDGQARTPDRADIKNFMGVALEKGFKDICIEYVNEQSETVMLKLGLLVYHFSNYAATLEGAGYCIDKIPRFTDQDGA